MISKDDKSLETAVSSLNEVSTQHIFPKTQIAANTVKKKNKNEGRKTGVRPGHNFISNPQYNLPLSQRFKEDEIISAMYKCKGLTAAVCAELDCTYQQLYSYLKTRPNVKEAQTEARQAIVSDAETVMVELLHSSIPGIQLDAAKFILKNQGRQVGWGDNPVIAQEISIADQTLKIRQIFGFSDETD